MKGKGARSVLVAVAVAAAGIGAARPAAALPRNPYLEESPRRLELTPYGGLFWSSGVGTSEGSIVFDAAPQAGAVLGFQVDARSQVEVLYLVAFPQARFETSSPFYVGSPSFPVLTQYLQVGGLTAFEVGDVEPFIAGGLGAVWFHPGDVLAPSGATIRPADTVAFAFQAGGGVKLWLSRKVGVRIEARLLFPTFFTSGAFLSGPNGAAVHVNAGIPLVQGTLTLGLAISP